MTATLPDTLAFYLAAVLYALAGAVLTAHLAGVARAQSAARLGLTLMGAAATAHAAHLIARWMHTEGPFANLGSALATVSWLVVMGLFALRRSHARVEVLGALVAPLALVLLIASRTPSSRSGGELGGALLALHVGSVVLATAAFTVAFTMATAYLLQEREVKRKRLGGLFKRLPPLDVLDELGYRCVAIGLPALTLGIVTGLFVGARVGATVSATAWQQYVAMGAWVLFAAVLLLRLAAGWRGRRAAFGTILGYMSALVVLAGYYVRRGGS